MFKKLVNMEYPLNDGKGTKAKSIKEFKLKDGTIIGIFQGSRGQNKDLDIIVKYIDKHTKKFPRTPQHVHWAADLLVKKAHNEQLTKEFVKYLLDMWDKVEPFRTKEEQQNCELKLGKSEDLKKFEELNDYGEYKVEFIVSVIELLMIQEKTGNAKAFLFKKVLDGIYNDKDLFSTISTSGFKGKKGK
jgi:hypothetical protein